MSDTGSVNKPVLAKSRRETTINMEMAVRSVYPSRLKYVGATSGKAYEWYGAGDIVMVYAEDVPPLLAKRIGNRACCGAVQQGGNKVFELA